MPNQRLGRARPIRNGGQDTPLVEHIYKIIGSFEGAALGPQSEEEAIAFHERGRERGRELARETFADLFEMEVARN